MPRIDSSTVLSIEKFVPRDSIDPIYYDTSYYLVPDGNARERQDDVYVVLREAIERTGKVALSRVVLARRERAVAIMPMGDGLVLHTLHDMREITSPDQLFGELPNARPDREMVALATQLIDRQTARFAPEDMEDRYEARLRRVIEAKLKGLTPEPEPEPEERGNVVDLMAALRRSPRRRGTAVFAQRQGCGRSGEAVRQGCRESRSGGKIQPLRPGPSRRRRPNRLPGPLPSHPPGPAQENPRPRPPDAAPREAAPDAAKVPLGYPSLYSGARFSIETRMRSSS